MSEKKEEPLKKPDIKYVVERMRGACPVTEGEAMAVADYVAFLEFGYASLDRDDMQEQAEKSANERLVTYREERD